MKAFLSLAVGCLISLSAWAQETVAVNTGDIVSPELKNQTVTFKLLAPNAKEVVVEADFFEKNRHKAQRKAKFYINKCRSASCMQGGLKQASA